MNLVIDQGNTRTKAGIFKGNKLIADLQLEQLEKKDITEFLDKHHGIRFSILSSVIDTNNLLKELLIERAEYFLELEPHTPLPVKNCYKSPETLGKDRIAAVAGANNIYPGENVLVIDVGTAITFDLINNKGEYLGGNISPGVNIRFKALNDYTTKLPLLSVRDNYDLIAIDTESAIISGVMNGVLFEIQSYIEELKKKYNSLKIILTGGDSFLFDKKLKSTIFVNSNLVLSGLNYILNYNLSGRGKE